MSKQNEYNKEELEIIASTSTSMRQILLKIGLKMSSDNYRKIRKICKRLKISLIHLKGKGWNKGIKLSRKKSLDLYLSNKISITSHKLRLRLFEENIKEKMCEQCMQSYWNDKAITLELHHIDGNNKNNNLSNIQILCPNCHSQTDNYRSRNRN